MELKTDDASLGATIEHKRVVELPSTEPQLSPACWCLLPACSSERAWE